MYLLYSVWCKDRRPRSVTLYVTCSIKINSKIKIWGPHIVTDFLRTWDSEFIDFDEKGKPLLLCDPVARWYKCKNGILVHIWEQIMSKASILGFKGKYIMMKNSHFSREIKNYGELISLKCFHGNQTEI